MTKNLFLFIYNLSNNTLKSIKIFQNGNIKNNITLYKLIPSIILTSWSYYGY